MKKYNGSIVIKFDTNATGNAGSGKPVTVYFTGTITKAVLFEDDGITEIDNPVTADNDGNYFFSVNDGTYDLIIDEGLITEYSLTKIEIISAASTIPDLFVFEDVSKMITGDTLGGATINHELDNQYSTGGTTWRVTTTVEGVDLGGGLHAINVTDVFADDFNIVADGVTEDQAEWAYIISVAKEGSNIILPIKTATSIVDGTILTGKYRPAININREVTFVGNEAFTIKLKDFSTAWNNPTGGYIPLVIGINHSKAKVRGVIVNANSDNHYQINGGFKVWEFNTEATIPPAGIVAYCDELQANIEDVEISGCTIITPRAGIQAGGGLQTSGGGELITAPTFLNKTMTTSVVVGLKAFNNKIIRPRSNAMIAIAGVYNANFYDNEIYNNMYHAGRLYYAAIGCRMYNNNVYTSYDEIEATWNATDNGWWRTSDIADPEYKIDRAGFSIGSSLSDSGVGGGNVKDCSFEGNECHTSEDVRTSTIIDTVSDLASHYIMTNVNKNNTVKGNKSINSPYSVLRGTIDTAAPDSNGANDGCSFTGNIGSGAIRNCISSFGDGLIYSDNTFTNCVLIADGAQVRNSIQNTIVVRNSFISGEDTDLTAPVIQSRANSTASYYDMNIISKELTNRFDDEGSGVEVDGSDVPPRLLTPVNSWINEDVGGSSENLLSNSFHNGYVLVAGYLNAAAATNDFVSTTISTYAPDSELFFNAIDTDTGLTAKGTITTGGSISIVRGTSTKLFFSVSYRTSNLF